ncbi:MAG: hypothetical protein KatS3mg115_0657 [Candidatus Poribacteria bacterium]|nr:MAG: hypothetical protein KatS3mg115_0657 [Candidatus Poribacteria bacterium]
MRPSTRQLPVLVRLQLRKHLYEQLRETGSPPPGLRELNRVARESPEEEEALEAAWDQMRGEESAEAAPL